MKLILINVFVLLAAKSAMAAEPSPGAFDKLKKMFETAQAPASVAALLAEFPKIQGCAGSTEGLPNSIDNWAKPIKVSYTKPGFGPDFPAATITGVAFNSTTDSISTVQSSFFTNYKEALTAQGFAVSTTEYYEDYDCYTDTDDSYTCDTVTKSTNVNVKIRMTAKNILLQGTTSYAYCWK